MRIGFDAKRITNNATGLGNYSRYIVNTCVEFFPENEYFLYSPSKGDEQLRKRIIEHPSISFHYPQSGFSGKMKGWWRSYDIVNDLKTDQIQVFHGLSNEIPFSLQKRGIPSLVTIHDLIFLTKPTCYHPWDRFIYNYKYRKSACLADKIVAVSECTKKDIIKFWQIPESKIEVIYQGCDESFKKKINSQQKTALLEKYDLHKPYILYLGSIEERKNLLLLIKALKEIKGDIDVVAVGRRTSYTDTVEKYIQENNLQDRVKIISNVPFQDLPAFYQCAKLFVYPSFYEGFGIPIIEALHSGIPVIGATGSCLEEAGGDSSLYTDPENATELASLIKSVLYEPGLASHMVEEGREYVKRFDKKLVTEQLNSLYRGLI